MKKLKILGIIILLVVIVVLITGALIILKLFLPPIVKSSEKKNVTILVENYLTEKYGEHNFKVTNVEYKFNMTTLFDYSEIVGYNVRFKGDIIEHSFVYISGIDPNEYKITDSFIADYYFPDSNGFGVVMLMESIPPVEKIQDNFFNNFKQDFEPNCQTLTCDNPILNIPNDYGRIPTMEELKNDISYYEIRDFSYTLTDRIENEEEYNKQLSEYLKQSFGGDWEIYILSNVNISCYKK